MSLPEVLLWRKIQPRHFDGPHIRRQHPFGPYTLDFYCDSSKLCIEIDGQGHGFGDHPERDARRDAWLEEQGVRTLRLSAKLVLFNMDSALDTIRQALSERPHPPLRGPPSPTGKDF
jgi:very-short-patch-repair endonuclease